MESQELNGHKVAENAITKEGSLPYKGDSRSVQTRPAALKSDGGARNRITLLKLMAENSARERNADKLQEVVDRVIDLALIGNEAAMKLVWNSVMTHGAADDKTQAREKVEINITSSAPVPIRVAETLDNEASIENHE